MFKRQKRTAFVVAAVFLLTWGSAARAGIQLSDVHIDGGVSGDLAQHAEKNILFNPAGLGFEPENFIRAGKGLKLNSPDSGADDFDSYMPSIDAHWRIDDQWSLFGSLRVSNGGGSLYFDDEGAIAERINLFVFNRNAMSASLELEASHYMMKLGAARKIHDHFGVAAGIIGVSAKKNARLHAAGVTTPLGSLPSIHLDYDQSATGLTGFASAHYERRGWSLAVNFTGPVRLAFETDISSDFSLPPSPPPPLPNLPYPDIPGDPGEIREDLPAILSLGVKKNLSLAPGDLEIKTGFAYIFQESATWNSTFDQVAAGFAGGPLSRLGNGYEISVGFSWRPAKSRWTHYASYMYKNMGDAPQYMPGESRRLDFHVMGGGFRWQYSDRLAFSVDFAGLNVFTGVEYVFGVSPD
ncbi:exported hypothetical protein [Candidatus Desulfarcum epimagneticum]|uniref:Aromatic hydrocarbon degradation protein n=1 Tax=uncultured Desulfobacteraceae bacterium TaxID=218296 RepID=A0A484HL44_9BACT|nr:exported hypothetical protein [uncultured Desulfobacteraceae bacterium]